MNTRVLHYPFFRFSDFILAKNMGRPRTRKPRKYSELDINGNNLSNLSKPPMKPMKREDSKIKLVENHPWGYKCYCGKEVKHWNQSVRYNNIRLHLEVKTLFINPYHGLVVGSWQGRCHGGNGGPTICWVRLQLGI